MFQCIYFKVTIAETLTFYENQASWEYDVQKGTIGGHKYFR